MRIGRPLYISTPGQGSVIGADLILSRRRAGTGTEGRTAKGAGAEARAGAGLGYEGAREKPGNLRKANGRGLTEEGW